MNAHHQLQVNNLCCIRQQRFLFKNISFQLNSGELLLIKGSNGSGKSSLLKLLTGLLTPEQGEIFWQNKKIQQCYAEYYQDLHYVGHSNGIKLGLTIAENLQLTTQLSLHTSNKQAEVLNYLKLSENKNSLAKNLSAGQKRRIALAKLLLIPKKIWILDEPLTALDVDTQQLFLFETEKHLQNGGIAVITSHHSFTINHAVIKNLRLSSC